MYVVWSGWALLRCDGGWKSGITQKRFSLPFLPFFPLYFPSRAVNLVPVNWLTSKKFSLPPKQVKSMLTHKIPFDEKRPLLASVFKNCIETRHIKWKSIVITLTWFISLYIVQKSQNYCCLQLVMNLFQFLMFCFQTTFFFTKIFGNFSLPVNLQG